MRLLGWLGIVVAAGALLAGSLAPAEDSVGGVIAVPAVETDAAASRGDFLGEINQIRQESRSQRDITNLRIEQMEREIERSTGYIQNLLIAFLIAGGIVVFLVLNTIRHQSRVNIYRMRQLIRDSERALAEIDRHVQRPEYDHFQVARGLDNAMNHTREHDKSMSQKMISNVYAAADDPTLPVSLHYQANALKCEQGSDWRQAISYWERLHQMDDGNPEVLLHLASCYKGLAEVTSGPEASVYRDTSLRFFQIYTQRNRNLQQLQAKITSPVQPAKAPPAPVAVVQQPAAPTPAPVAATVVQQPASPAPSAPPPTPTAVVQPASPAPASAPAPAASDSQPLGQAAGQAVRSQVSMVGESAGKLGNSFKRVGASVASGIYDRIKNVPAAIADNAASSKEEDEEPVYIPERKKVQMPTVNYYREDSSGNSQSQPTADSSPKLAANAKPPSSKQPANQQEEPAAAKPAKVFAAPTIKPAAKPQPAKKAPAGKSKSSAAASVTAPVKANGAAPPPSRKPARKSAAGKKSAKTSAASRFAEHMRAAEQACKRFAASPSGDSRTHLQEAVSHYESAAKYSSSLTMYRLWGSALIELARMAEGEQADQMLVDAAEKFRQGEKIKPGSMSADLALAYALAGQEDECRQAVGHCLKNGQENLGEYFAGSAFDRYRSADWFVTAQAKIAA